MNSQEIPMNFRKSQQKSAFFDGQTRDPRGRARSEPRRQRCGAEAVRRGGRGAKFGDFFLLGGEVGDVDKTTIMVINGDKLSIWGYHDYGNPHIYLVVHIFIHIHLGKFHHDRTLFSRSLESWFS